MLLLRLNAVSAVIERLSIGKLRQGQLTSLLRVSINALSAGIPGVNISDFSGRLKILVKPNSVKDEILSWDDSRKAWRVAISAPAEENKANIAVIKFFSKLTKKRVRIVSGLASKEKILSIS